MEQVDSNLTGTQLSLLEDSKILSTEGGHNFRLLVRSSQLSWSSALA